MLDIKERVLLGNLLQTIHIKGNDEKNPVLLFVHGGPGISNRHTVMQSNDDLLDDFTIVAWDQRGTAGSYFGAKAEDLTIEQFVEDARELVEYLCAKFNKKKIFVIGGSWGSLLGTRLLHKYPEKIAAFVGFGQFVNGHLNELISWQYCIDEVTKANDLKALEVLKKVGPPEMGIYKGGFAGMKIQRDIMMKYGGYSKNKGKRSYMDAFVKPVLKSGEYTLKEIYGYAKGYKFVLNNMWSQVGETDFTKTCTEFAAPIFIFNGRLDMNTPAVLVEDWFNMIEAPVKELHWFENSGHNPMMDEEKEFKALLKDKLLKIAKEENL
ncbi:MAG: alpha/beta fold hydrolase [Erysipelotrichaceae bacterium]